MAITINGSGSITGISAGGLPDGCVDNDTLASSFVTVNGTTIALGGSESITAGKVLQVQYLTTNTTSSTTGTTYITGHSHSITPSSSSSKIIVMGNAVVSGNTYTFGGKLRIVRTIGGTTTSVLEGANGYGYALCGSDNYSSDANASNGFSFVDTPATTSACTYAIQFASQSGNTISFNKFTYRNQASVASLVLMEIAG